ncbi:hypothetical protein NDU88_003054 [Pleurodeles waltl]|uniref:Uncharacterized protein n=1 Tax=Pleurodeles waltl TaxID=8319 RepID=A0AAV7QBQ6_PLEWA|nr:hypothetical protein NDU88_003054 [Pleurodeles waltl]
MTAVTSAAETVAPATDIVASDRPPPWNIGESTWGATEGCGRPGLVRAEPGRASHSPVAPVNGGAQWGMRSEDSRVPDRQRLALWEEGRAPG